MIECKGYPGYHVTKRGEVFSSRRGGMVRLKLQSFDGLYQTVGVVRGRKQIPVRVHRLVATAYIPNPDGKKTVNHKDSNKFNNCVDNLEWATHSENNLHGYKYGNMVGPGKRGVVAIDPISGVMHTFKSLTIAAKKIVTSTSGISKACKGKAHSAGGYAWEYNTGVNE